MNWDLLHQLLLISVPCGTITLAFIQKTKVFFKNSTFIVIYGLFVNIVFGLLFTYSFSPVDIASALWIGLFSFIGADTLYKALEGKIKPLSLLKGSEIKYDL